MSLSCGTSSLTSAATSFTSLSEKQLRAVRIYAKCAELNGTTVTTNPNTLVGLATAAGYMNMSVKQQMAVETYLDCQLANGGTGGGLSGTGSPEGVTTANPGATYFDTASASLWAKQTGTGNTGWTQLIA
jgi:hypothetical protein